MPTSAPCLHFLNRTLWREAQETLFQRATRDHPEPSRPAPTQEPQLWKFTAGRISRSAEMVKGVFVGEIGSSRGLEKDGEAERHGEDSPGGVACLSRSPADVGTPALAAWHPRLAQAREMGKLVAHGVGLACVNPSGANTV